MKRSETVTLRCVGRLCNEPGGPHAHVIVPRTRKHEKGRPYYKQFKKQQRRWRRTFVCGTCLRAANDA